MTDIWIFMRPAMVGIFTEYYLLSSTIRQYGVEGIYKIANEVVAAKLVRDTYSDEALFLMEIDDCAKMMKNCLYKIPEDCIGKFKENKNNFQED